MYGSVNGFIDTSEGSKEYSVVAYSSLMRNEILGTEIEDCKEVMAHWNQISDGSNPSTSEERRTNIFSQNAARKGAQTSSRNLYTYKAR